MAGKKPEHTEELGRINNKIIAAGEALPVVKLRDGSPVQTGTVAAMLANVKRFDAGERGAVERELELSVPTLVKVGLFDLFPAEEWVRGRSVGRRFVGEKAMEFLKSKGKGGGGL